MPHRWDPKAPPARGLVRPVPVDPAGVSGPTPGQARGPRWRRSTRNLYVPAHVSDERVEQRILEQSTVIGSTGVVTGWAALRLLGGNFFDGLARDGRTRLPVPISANGERMRSTDERVVRRDLVPPEEVWMRHGIRCASPERALFDQMASEQDLREAVVDIDTAAAAEITSLRRMRAYAGSRARAAGRRTGPS